MNLKLFKIARIKTENLRNFRQLLKVLQRLKLHKVYEDS